MLSASVSASLSLSQLLSTISMSKFLSRLLPRSPIRPTAIRANRTVRFSDTIQYRPIPARGHDQRVESQSPAYTGSLSSPSPQDTTHSQRSGRDSSHSRSLNPFTRYQGTPSPDQQTPRVRESTLPRSTTFQAPITPQANREATQTPASVSEISPLSWPKGTHLPTPRMSPVPPSRFSTLPAVSTPRTSVDGTPQGTFSRWTPSPVAAPAPQSMDSPVGSQTSATSNSARRSIMGNYVGSTHSFPVAYPSGRLINSIPYPAPATQYAAPNPRHRSRVENPLRRNQMNALLASGQLKWDIRDSPERATLDAALPYAWNLDLPAFSKEITRASIRFENPAFDELWGPIRVRSPRASTNDSATFISIRDVLKAIYSYFMEPIQLNDGTKRAAILPVRFRGLHLDDAKGGKARLRLLLD
ncbi:hypothetical protein M413DRAFT_28253 [Hebeloma cylindrosporum]|uniref:DUF6699 domain-containing protein n=1 Tax=Hebeloma cylindrosporum TaxID=76867 RepID=A0A0C2XU77_HEBCY|nr:hypothetical protein M413DRAFT_28253 [Hebeloma cylindrosporum h7]